MFFQHHPHSAQHAAIHWGHVSSPDLLTWTEEPLALTPREGLPDAFGCWSGVVIVDEDTPTAVYSAVLDPGGASQVLLATSDRTMRHWDQGSHPVAELPPGVVTVRDPFLFEVDGSRWAVQGAGLADGRGAVLAWSCHDLQAWDYRGVVLAADHPLVAAHAASVVWECPQLVQLGGSWVLLLSLIEQWGRPDPGPVVAFRGELDVRDGGLVFEPVEASPVDTGVLYAPQVLALPERALLWGWVPESGRTAEECDAAGWAGLLTLPRELDWVGGVLTSRPAVELDGLRRGEVDAADPGDAFEVDSGPGTLRVALGGRAVIDRKSVV